MDAFEKVVDITAYRQARPVRQPSLFGPVEGGLVEVRRLDARAVTHRARMLAHLMLVGGATGRRPWRSMQR